MKSRSGDWRDPAVRPVATLPRNRIGWNWIVKALRIAPVGFSGLGHTLDRSSPLFTVRSLRILAPTEFVRQEGGPEYVERLIDVAGYEGPYVLHVLNGDINGDFRVSSGWLCLDGQLPLEPEDFSQQAWSHEVEIDLGEASMLGIRLASVPGSKLTIWIEGMVPDCPTLKSLLKNPPPSAVR